MAAEHKPPFYAFMVVMIVGVLVMVHAARSEAFRDEVLRRTVVVAGEVLDRVPGSAPSRPEPRTSLAPVAAAADGNDEGVASTRPAPARAGAGHRAVHRDIQRDTHRARSHHGTTPREGSAPSHGKGHGKAHEKGQGGDGHHEARGHGNGHQKATGHGKHKAKHHDKAKHKAKGHGKGHGRG